MTTPDPRSRTDLWDGLAWAALGTAILVASLLMDRLPEQGVPPFAAPGLMPGLLGIVMILFGALMALRRRSPGAVADATARHRPAMQIGRLALVIGLCMAFSLVLVGHGMPFWVAAALFVTVSILVLQHHERRARGHKLDARAVIVAAVIGLGAGVIATLVFQSLFLVHLP